MGYYYDWLNSRWVEKSLTPPKQPRREIPRQDLLTALIEEMVEGDSETCLYAGLLARKLIVGNEVLMRQFGKKVARLTMPSPGKGMCGPGLELGFVRGLASQAVP